MLFTPIPLDGAYLIEPELIEDERGFFARTWCADQFERHGLNHRLVQCNVSFNHRAGTLRGMHYQQPPHAEAKLVRCTTGALYDVVIDLRPDSPTFRQWFGAELSAANRRMLYAPEGFAHGFETLVDNTEVFYQMSEPFHPECAASVGWDDPQFSIEWPITPTVISKKDRQITRFVA